MSEGSMGGGMREVERLFEEALGVGEGEREAWVSARTGGDEALRARVLRLLRAHAGAESVLPTPPEGGLGVVPEEGGDPLVGQTLGSFRLGAMLGAGGMCAVYDATQDSPRRRVAVKVLHAALLGRDASQRFRLEAEVLGSLEHAGIAHVYEAGVATLGFGRVPYLAMEYVDGATLLVHAERAGLAIEERVQLMVAVCEAVEHAHRKGVIHRDLKPGNIMVTAAGQVKVLDFGVARWLNRDTGATAREATREGQLIGTLQYMSPEQVKGDPRGVDTRTDVYALGVVLYELLSGFRPYDVTGMPVAEAAAVIRDCEPRALGSVGRGCGGDLETIVGKAMAKDAGERYQSAAELGADLRRYLASEPILARPVSGIYVVRKFVARNRVLSGAAVAVVGALVLGVVGMWIGLDRAQRAMVAAEEAREAESAALSESRRHEADAKLSAREAEFQSYVASLAAAAGALEAFDVAGAKSHLGACAEHMRGWEWSHLRAMADDSVATYAMTSDKPFPEGVWDIAVSEDGKMLAVVENSRRLVVWDTGAGRVVKVFEPRAETGDQRMTLIHGVSLSADGSVLACAHAWGGVGSVWDTASWKMLFVMEGHTNEVEDVEVSPDGRVVATASFDGTVGMYSVAEGKRIGVLTGHGGAVRSVSFSADGKRLASSELNGLAISWDVAEMRPIARAKSMWSGTGGPSSISPDGKRVLSVRDAGSPWIWDAETGEPLVVLQGHRTACASAAWSPDGLKVLVGTQDRAIRVHDAKDGRLLGSYRGHESPVSSVRFAGDGASVFSAGYGDTSGVRMWSTVSSAVDLEVRAHPGDFGQIVMSEGGELFATIGVRWGNVVVQETGTGRVVGFMRCEGRALRAAFGKDRRLYVVQDDGSLWCWTRGAGVVRVGASEGALVGQVMMGVSEDGGLVYARGAASGGVDRRWVLPGAELTAREEWLRGVEGLVDAKGGLALRVTKASRLEGIEAGTGKVLWDAPVGGGAVLGLGVTVSWDSMRCVVATSEADLTVVDMRNGAILADLKGALRDTQSVAMSADGTRVATGMRNGATVLWSVESGRRVYALQGLPSWIEVIAFSPGGGEVVTGDSGGRVRIWESTGRAARIARSAREAVVAARAAELFAEAVRERRDLGGIGEWVAARGVGVEVNAEVERLAEAYPATTEGTVEWAVEVLSATDCTEQAVGRVGENLGPVSRYMSTAAGVHAVMALYHLRRVGYETEASRGDGPSALESARNRVQLARGSLGSHDRDAALVEVVEALWAQAAGQPVDGRAVRARIELVTEGAELEPRVEKLLGELRE